MDNIKDILISLRLELARHRVKAILLAFAVFFATIALAVKWPKVYVSSTVIMMDVTNVIEPLLRGAAEVAGSDRNEKVKDVLASRRLLEAALKKMYPDFEEWTPEVRESYIFKARQNLMIQRHNNNKNFTRVSYSATTAEAAYQTLDKLVTAFIDDRAAEKQRESSEAHSFISEQVRRYKDRLELAELKLKEFKSNSVDATEGTVKRRISNLQADIENLRITINESEEKIRITSQQLRQEEVDIGSKNQIQALQVRRAAMASELDGLRMVYQESYPDIVTLRSQIRELDNEMFALTGGRDFRIGESSELPLVEELRKQLSTAKVNLKTQKRRLRSLEGLLEKEFEVADQVAENQAGLMHLTRDYDVTKSMYEEMLERKENANLTLELNDRGQGESYRVLEPPLFPLEPAGIKASYIFFAAPLLALLAPIGLALVFVFLDPRIRSADSLTRHLPEGVRMLTAIPHRSSLVNNGLMLRDTILLVLLVGVAFGYWFIYTKMELFSDL